jgi:inner membrane protein
VGGQARVVMDPLSQAVLGAAAAQVVVGKRLGRKTWWLGALGGMAPDLDVFIRSANDPLLALELHRHFTHSLAFIPVGGLLVAAPFVWLARKEPREHKWIIAAATTAGWATHGLLDAFTSYGTLLWWPFSRTRVAWDWISVIDPIYTVILAIGVVLAARRNDAKPAWVALVCSSLYLGFCGLQHYRALLAQANLAELREQQIVRGTAQPLLFTNLLWRSIYETEDGRLHVDALSIPWWAKINHHGYATRRKVAAPSEPSNTRERDLARFAWFANDWVYAAPELAEAGEEVYCDARYSLHPARFDGIFCIAFASDGSTRVLQRRPEDSRASLREMRAMFP